jgi:hypothetical protein
MQSYIQTHICVHTHIRTYAHTHIRITPTHRPYTLFGIGASIRVWMRGCVCACACACVYMYVCWYLYNYEFSSIYHSHYFTLTHKTSELCMILRIYKITTLMTFHVTHFSYKIIQILSGQANRSGCALTRKGHNSNCGTGACCTVLLSLSVVF